MAPIWPLTCKKSSALKGQSSDQDFCRSKILILVANASTSDIQVTTPCSAMLNLCCSKTGIWKTREWENYVNGNLHKKLHNAWVCKDLVYKKSPGMTRGSWQSCTQTKEHNDGLQVLPTIWSYIHSSQHSLGLISYQKWYMYTCPLWLSIDTVNTHYSPNPMTLGDPSLKVLDKYLQWMWNQISRYNSSVSQIKLPDVFRWGAWTAGHETIQYCDQELLITRSTVVQRTINMALLL